MADTASELYKEMYSVIHTKQYRRITKDRLSPMQEDTIEAEPGSTFQLRKPKYCVCNGLEARWATANVLHFFAGTEEAAPLLKYNRYAAKFLTGSKWVGAYGAAVLHQLKRGVELLAVDRTSRRAIAVMLNEGVDINRPACITSLHMLYAHQLDLLVYQRSLYLTQVMKYDCVLLANILNWAAYKTELTCGYLRWTIGSLHMKIGDISSHDMLNYMPFLIPPEVLDDEGLCWQLLCDPHSIEYKPFTDYLRSAIEVRL